jgi:hypothetical protein
MSRQQVSSIPNLNCQGGCSHPLHFNAAVLLKLVDTDKQPNSHSLVVHTVDSALLVNNIRRLWANLTHEAKFYGYIFRLNGILVLNCHISDILLLLLFEPFLITIFEVNLNGNFNGNFQQ